MRTPTARYLRGVRALFAAAVVVASQAGDASCEDIGSIGYSCHVRRDGPKVDEKGRVVATVRHYCDPGLEPQDQDFYTWIEIRRSDADKWIAVGNTGVEHRPPRPEKPDIYELRDGRCQADIEYGVAYRTLGVDHDGVAFDTGIKRDLVAVTTLC